MTFSNNYKPTPAQQKLIEVLIDPNHSGKSVTEICKIANVSRDAFYDAIKKPEFSEYVNKITYDLIKSKASELYNAIFKYAISNPKNGSDRKLLAEMLGLYTPKQVTEQINHNIDYDISQLNEDQRAAILTMIKGNSDPVIIDNYYKECIANNDSTNVN